MDPRFLGFVLLLLTAGALVAWFMALRHRKAVMLHDERMAAMEKGLPVPVVNPNAPWSVRTYLLRGMMWSFSGVALAVFLLAVAVSTNRPPSAESRLYEAHRISQALNMPMEQAVKVVDEDRQTGGRRDRMSASVAMIALIPIAVGLAYLVFYRTDKRRME
jgi:preprotein translocase subunit YajC